MYLRAGRVGVFDLVTSEAGEEELQDEATWGTMSALATADRLVSKHGLGSIVLGTGVLTGSLAPAACAGLIQAGPGKDGSPRRMPLLGFAGVELKLSGFDFVVVRGEAEKPGYLWIRDGIIEFVAAPEMKSLDSWARTDKIRADQGDAKIQVLSAGQAGDAGEDWAQLVTNYWGGEDKAGVGSEFGRKGLVAIAFRGMGELEVSEPAGHFEHAIGVRKGHLGRLGLSAGLASYSEAAKRGDFQKLVHRHVACFGCPFPCRSFLKVHEDPKEMRLMGREPGYLVYDIPALEKAFELGLSAKDAVLVLIRCARAGIEPFSALWHLENVGAEVSLKSIESLTSAPSAAVPSVEAKAPRSFEASFDNFEKYEKCVGLGLCPRYWSKAGLDMTVVASFAEAVLGRGLTAGDQ
ncbi:MAG: aldehyde ferredoxin oxidoreductase N-terminal domain-containing protein [Thermoplasmata archaeon]